MQLQCSNHAIMRTLQRKHNQTIINDRTFDQWKKLTENATEQIKDAQTELKMMVETADYSIKGNFDKKKEPSEYKIHLNSGTVVVLENELIITIHDLCFSENYSEKLNATIAEALLKEIVEKDLILQASEEKNRKQEKEINSEIDNLEKEVKNLNEKAAILNKERDLKRQLIELEKKKESVLRVEVEELKRKICKPLYAERQSQ